MNVIAHAVYLGVRPQHSIELGVALAAQQQAIIASDEASGMEGGVESLRFGTAGEVSGLAQPSAAFGPVHINSVTTPY